LAGAFLAPYLYGLFSKKITKAACVASFIFGVGITVGHMFLFSLGLFPDLNAAVAGFPLNLASPINAGAFAMLINLLIVPLVSAVTRPKNPEFVDELFVKCGDWKK
jgi:SSS family solute:Na+ symporter